MNHKPPLHSEGIQRELGTGKTIRLSRESFLSVPGTITNRWFDSFVQLVQFVKSHGLLRNFAGISGVRPHLSRTPANGAFKTPEGLGKQHIPVALAHNHAGASHL